MYLSTPRGWDIPYYIQGPCLWLDDRSPPSELTSDLDVVEGPLAALSKNSQFTLFYVSTHAFNLRTKGATDLPRTCISGLRLSPLFPGAAVGSVR